MPRGKTLNKQDCHDWLSAIWDLRKYDKEAKQYWAHNIEIADLEGRKPFLAAGRKIGMFSSKKHQETRLVIGIYLNFVRPTPSTDDVDMLWEEHLKLLSIKRQKSEAARNKIKPMTIENNSTSKISEERIEEIKNITNETMEVPDDINKTLMEEEEKPRTVKVTQPATGGTNWSLNAEIKEKAEEMLRERSKRRMKAVLTGLSYIATTVIGAVLTLLIITNQS